MVNTQILCPRGNEIKIDSKEMGMVLHTGFKRYAVACVSCPYPSFNNEQVRVSYSAYDGNKN